MKVAGGFCQPLASEGSGEEGHQSIHKAAHLSATGGPEFWQRSLHRQMARFATICMSNQNRSMEAHHVLAKKGLNVESYGTNTIIKIPGPAIDKPNCYQFGMSYEDIYQDLVKKDQNLYATRKAMPLTVLLGTPRTGC